MRKLWIRVGMEIKIDDEEERAIFLGEKIDRAKALKKILEEGRAYVDGEAYVPPQSVSTFNSKYHTEYEIDAYECDLDYE